MKIRFLVGWGLVAGFGSVCAYAAERAEVDFAFVRAKAEALAGEAYVDPADELPRALSVLGYDRYRAIRFASEQALWREDRLPFRLQFFHMGGLFRTGVRLHEFSTTHVQEIPFSSALFDYGPEGVPGRLPTSLGYAGFRVHAPINRPDYFDEVISFLGASYFRAVAEGQVYGLSARGLAVDSGLPGVPEEFPRFTDFWIGKPRPEDGVLTIYAVLDSPRIAGAFSFLVSPGETTIVEVTVALFPREAIEVLGLAPLTSMFWYGENTDRPAGEPRPEVHDSDGLLVAHGGGEVTWHPLRQVTRPRHVAFAHDGGGLRGFGLLQRDREFGHYQDTEARYDIRPSAWVEPVRGFDAGEVRLVELPAQKEYGDNVVAYWMPAAAVVAGQPIEYAYRLSWLNEVTPQPTLAKAVATRRGNPANGETGETVWVDFAGDALAAMGEEEPTLDLMTGDGVGVKHQAVIRLPDNRGWRVALQLGAPAAGADRRLSCRLLRGFEPVTERWSYTWQP